MQRGARSFRRRTRSRRHVSECEVEIANLQAELMLPEGGEYLVWSRRWYGCGGGEAVEEAAASSSQAASSSSSSAAAKTRRDDDVSYTDEIELLEKQLLHAQATHAELLTRTSAALEGEAEVRIELKLLEERTPREHRLDAKPRASQKDLEALTRLKKGAGAGSSSPAVRRTRRRPIAEGRLRRRSRR